MARQSLSPMKNLDYYDDGTVAVPRESSVGRKRKDAPMTHLKYLRKKNGYTLETLSEITSVSVSYLSRLESGTRRLNTDLIRRLSHAFRCSPAELLQEISHDSNVVTSVDFGRKKHQELISRESNLPLYKVVPSEEDPEKLTISICPSTEWSLRPSELASKNEVFAIKAGGYFKPHFSETSTLYLEPATNLVPESTVVILDRGKIMIKKIWSVTPKTLQLCDIGDMEALKNGTSPKSGLLELNRSDLEATYKVVGYSDFSLD